MFRNFHQSWKQRFSLGGGGTLIERANGWKLTAPLQVCNMWCFKTASFKMHTFIPLFPLMTLFLKLNHDEVSVTL